MNQEGLFNYYFGKINSFGGENNLETPNGNVYSSTLLDRDAFSSNIMSKNSFGYYEKKIDMNILQLKGSAESLNPAETEYSMII